MRSAIIAIFLCLACAKAQDIILLGDSLSDNGNGYAATVKFVLQTNEVWSHSVGPYPGIGSVAGKYNAHHLLAI